MSDPYVETSVLKVDDQIVAHSAYCSKCGLGVGSYHDQDNLDAAIAAHLASPLHAAGPALEAEGG